MVHRIRRIGVAQLAKMLGAMYLGLGVIFGVCIWAFSSLMPGASRPGFFGMGAGVVLVIPIVYAVLGVVFGVIAAWLYNMIAGSVGGVEIDLEPGV